MFVVDVPPVPYADPWKESYEERLAALARGRRRVAYYYERPDNSTFRYRVYNMIQALGESKHGVSAAYFTQSELDSFADVVDLADVVVLCRSLYSDKLNHAITKARSKGKRVLFDIDDLVFDAAYVHLLLHTLDQDLGHPNVWDFWFAYVGRIGATLSLCDEVITTNNYLASRIKDYCGKPVSIIPNFLNREQMDISLRIFEEKKKRGFARNEKIHLGYFSGTPSHDKDFEIVSSTLVDLLAIDPRLCVLVVGFMDIKGPLQNYTSRIICYPLHDFVNLQRLIGLVEINLIPLQDNVFTNCKSELKYFEAGIVGTVSVASPVFTYARAIQDGQNGYLARSFEWYEKLAALVDKVESGSSYPAMAQKAFCDSEQKYGWYNQADLIERVLFSKSPPRSQERLDDRLCS